jgi:hypothetical protein
MFKEAVTKTVLAGAAIAGIVGFVGAGYGVGVIVYSVSHPCVTEDSSNCFTGVRVNVLLLVSES